MIVPFRGGDTEALAAWEGLGHLRLVEGDELLIVDNTADQDLAAVLTNRAATVVPAPEHASPYYARNVGAERARNDWLLFIDADCRPRPSLLEDYLSGPIEEHEGAVAGAVVGAPHQAGPIPRYIRARDFLDQEANLRHRYRPAAVTANLLVRRSAWASVGGFYDEIVSGGDSDFCWRMQEAGWKLGYRAGAVVEHQHRETLPALLRQVARDGAGSAWLNRRHRGSAPPPKVPRSVARSITALVKWLVKGQRERGAFRGLDGLVVIAYGTGYLLDAAAPSRRLLPVPHGCRVLLVDEPGELERPGLLDAAGADGRLRIVATRRSAQADRDLGRRLEVSYLEDDGALRRLRATGWLIRWHPLAMARDLLGPHRGGRDEVPIVSLAPCARRIARAGERVIAASGTPAEATGRRLAHLARMPFEPIDS